MERRTFCRNVGLGTAVAAGLAGCVDRSGVGDEVGSASTPTDAERWPTFGADDAHTGFRPDGTGPGKGTVAWSAVEDAPTVNCSPTVADGRVYVGSAANAVHAFDAASGEVRWEFETTSYVETAPTVRDGRVYAADADGVVYVLSTDGEEVWRRETERNLHAKTLAVDDARVYVGTAGNMPAVVSGETNRSKAGKVVALDAEDGAERWSFSGPEDWFTGPALGDGRVFVGNHDGSVSALDAEGGEEVWSWSPAEADGIGESMVLVPPTFADGTLYVPLHGSGWLVALDADSGDVAWRRDLKAGNVKSSPAVTDDRIYLGATVIRGVALEGAVETDVATDEGRTGEPDETDRERTTGAAKTTRRPERTPTGTPESGTTGTLYALAREDGAEVWRHETDRDFRSSPAVVGDRVYVGGGDGAVALTRENGEEVWTVSFDRYVDSSPAVVDGRLYVGSADGHLYCVE